MLFWKTAHLEGKAVLLVADFQPFTESFMTIRIDGAAGICLK
jgi:hypothetical protein